MTDFVPPLWLKNGHIQSMLTSSSLRRLGASRRAGAVLAAERSMILDCGHGVRLEGLYSTQQRDDDWGNSQNSLSSGPSGPSTGPPLVVMIHGWEGSGESVYLLSACAYLFDRGYDILRLHLRDHGDTHHLNEDLFHSCRIVEVVGAFKRIQDLFPERRLLLAGFSLGANFALRVAARAPAAGIHIECVVAVCPVLDPNITMEVLDKGWFGYHDYFVYKWRRSLLKKQQCFPEKYDFKLLPKMRRLNDMTDHFVQHYSEFEDSKSYFNGYAITGDVLEYLDVPSHIIQSADDPIIPAEDLTRLASSPSLHIDLQQYGGHCGFIEHIFSPSWADRKIAEIFEQQ